MEREDDFSFCQTELKRINPVAHFMALTAPVEHRPALIAFYAFLAELARIPATISEPSMGEIRLQWWRDIVTDPACDDKQGCGSANIGPLGSAVKQVQRQYHLSTDVLLQTIDARAFDLYNDPMPDLATYEAYAGETLALPLMQAAQILNRGENPQELADLCGHAAMAISLSRHLLTWPIAAQSRKLFLPGNAFAKYGADVENIFHHQRGEEVRSAIIDLCTLAEEHQTKAKTLYAALKGKGQAHLAPTFLALAPITLTLKMRSKAPFKDLRLPNWRAYWHIWRMAAKS